MLTAPDGGKAKLAELGIKAAPDPLASRFRLTIGRDAISGVGRKGVTITSGEHYPGFVFPGALT